MTDKLYWSSTLKVVIDFSKHEIDWNDVEDWLHDHYSRIFNNEVKMTLTERGIYRLHEWKRFTRYDPDIPSAFYIE